MANDDKKSGKATDKSSDKSASPQSGGMEFLLANNKTWAAKVSEEDPQFFSELSKQQKPEYLWIGCADSRVPANQIVGLPPGAVFVHRNIANVVAPADINCHSVMQYAVSVLKVKHIIVCGHYGCGGVKAAMTHNEHGLLDLWLRNIKDVYQRHSMELDVLDEGEREDRLCVLNVDAQVINVGCSPVVQHAWREGQELTIHGAVYSLSDGRLRRTGARLTSPDQIPAIFRFN